MIDLLIFVTCYHLPTNYHHQEAIQEIQSDISNLTQTLSKKDKQLNEAQKIIEDEREKETTLISYPLLVEGERIPKELNRLVGLRFFL